MDGTRLDAALCSFPHLYSIMVIIATRSGVKRRYEIIRWRKLGWRLTFGFQFWSFTFSRLGSLFSDNHEHIEEHKMPRYRFGQHSWRLLYLLSRDFAIEESNKDDKWRKEYFFFNLYFIFFYISIGNIRWTWNLIDVINMRMNWKFKINAVNSFLIITSYTI